MPEPAQYPEILSDLADCILERLCLNVQIDQAGPVALEIAEAIRARFAGCLIYIPTGAAFARTQRDKAIVAQFDGSNHAALASRYSLTVSTIYEIIRKQRKLTPSLDRSRRNTDPDPRGAGLPVAVASKAIPADRNHLAGRSHPGG